MPRIRFGSHQDRRRFTGQPVAGSSRPAPVAGSSRPAPVAGFRFPMPPAVLA